MSCPGFSSIDQARLKYHLPVSLEENPPLYTKTLSLVINLGIIALAYC
jgi:hypothetical protein